MKTDQLVTRQLPTASWRPPDPKMRSPRTGGNRAGASRKQSNTTTNIISLPPPRSRGWVKLGDAAAIAYLRRIRGQS